MSEIQVQHVFQSIEGVDRIVTFGTSTVYLPDSLRSALFVPCAEAATTYGFWAYMAFLIVLLVAAWKLWRYKR